MKRLTKRDEYGNADIIGVDSADLQGNLSSKEFNRVIIALNKLAAYEELEDDGRLIKLPCKTGDRLYKVYKRPMKCSAQGLYRGDYAWAGRECAEFDIYYEWSIYEYKTTAKDIVCLMDEIGKTVFLTREEAEKALWERNCGKENG